MRRGSGNGDEFSSDALDHYSDEPDFKMDPEAYVNHIAKAKEALRIPVIASLNGATFGGWQRYAHLIEQAGADAENRRHLHAHQRPLRRLTGEVDPHRRDLPLRLTREVEMLLQHQVRSFR